MFSRYFLLVLAVLVCLQSFTATNGNGPQKCCFRYQTNPIPVRVISGYKETEHQCPKHGVIFTLKDGREVCADPGVEWVKNHMKRIDLQRPGV